MSAPLFLGLDLSTQALKASLLDEHLAGVDELSIRFDEDLTEFGTTSGVLPQGHKLMKGVPDAVGAPVRMYVAAFDLLWERAAVRGWAMDRIRAISAAGMQHASVYLTQKALDVLADPKNQPLIVQLDDAAFSRQIVPNWQDASTLRECAELTRCAEVTCGASPQSTASESTNAPPVPALSRITGSTAQTRFTAAQIMRFCRDEPEEYAATARIALVSNFVASLLCAGSSVGVAPLDESDACGMNLLDMSSGHIKWSEPLLALVSGACDIEGRPTSTPDAAKILADKLGPVANDPTVPVGHVGTWLQQRYGLSSECVVCLSTGDNPATIQCLAPRLGEAVVSLGTSDTAFVPSPDYAPSIEHHTFAHPASLAHADPPSHATPPYFLMLVFKNGSLAREWVRDTYCASDWDVFNAAVGAASMRNIEAAGFYWLKPEIIPYDARGVHRYENNKDAWASVESFAVPRNNAPAMVVSQFMALRVRIGQILGNTPLKRVYAVGGAARNEIMCSTLADVLGCEVVRPVVSGRDASGQHIEYNFTSVGAACRARWVHECGERRKRGEASLPYEEVIARARSGKVAHRVVAQPRPDAQYAAFEPTWRALEARALNERI